MMMQWRRDDFESGGAWSPRSGIITQFCFTVEHSIVFKAFGISANRNWLFMIHSFVKSYKRK